MKLVTPFESMNFWTQGPWMLFNMGVRFMQSWQEECFSRLRLMPVARPYTAFAGLTAQTSTRSVDASRDQAKRAELQQLNAAVAARQGRTTPSLGCLQNVEVVGGPEFADSALVRPVEKAVPARPALVKAADSLPKPAAKKAESVVVKLHKSPDVPAETVSDSDEPITAPVSSVTSMLAMQAKSLAKAVTTSPRQTAVKPAAKVATKPDAKSAVKKPAAKPVAKPTAKPATKPVSKAKPAASKKS